MSTMAIVAGGVVSFLLLTGGLMYLTLSSRRSTTGAGVPSSPHGIDHNE